MVATQGRGQVLARLSEIRRSDPTRIARSLASRRRRPLWNEAGTMFLLAADHPARGVLAAGSRPSAMADRGELLDRLEIALERPGVDGVMATPDVIEDLALLGALNGKLAFGSMNRGGLAGTAFELDDRFTAYDAAAVERDRLDGGKLMVRIADDPGTLNTLVVAARAISDLAARSLPTIVEVFASRVVDGLARNVDDTDALIRAVAIASGLGTTSAYTWLKLPLVEGMDRVAAAASLPILLLGGDPGREADAMFRRWEAALRLRQVRGIVAGRALLYPEDSDVAKAVDNAAAIVANRG